jgi:hypothetical protein
MTCGSRAGSDPICCHGSREDLRSVWPALRLAGITGYRPASCGDSRPIPVRDLRGMEISRRRLRPVGQQKLPICRDFGGSDGTRTRDLRRDRPVLALAERAGIGGDSQHKQVFSPVVLRGSPAAGGGFRRPPAGSARDVTLAYSQAGATTPVCYAKRLNQIAILCGLTVKQVVVPVGRKQHHHHAVAERAHDPGRLRRTPS